MSTPTIIHPIFQECEKYTLDPYWQDIFHKCACNRFPRGIRYEWRKNIVYVRLPGGPVGKSKIETFHLPKESTEIFEMMMTIFHDFGLRSKRDMDIKKDELLKIRKERSVNLDCQWKDLKPKYLKDRMISNFVLYLKEKHNLSTKESKNLLITIDLGFQLKQLNPEDIEYEKGKITEIQGLEFDSEKRNFYVSRKIKKCSKTDKPSTGSKFLSSFEIYLRESKKHRLKI